MNSTKKNKNYDPLPSNLKDNTKKAQILAKKQKQPKSASHNQNSNDYRPNYKFIEKDILDQRMNNSLISTSSFAENTTTSKLLKCCNWICSKLRPNSQLKSKIEELQNQKTILKSQNAQKQHQIFKLTSQKHKAQTTLSNNQEQINKISQQLLSIQDRNCKLQRELKRLISQSDKANLQHQRKQSNYKNSIKSLNQKITKNQAQNEIQRKIMEQKLIQSQIKLQRHKKQISQLINSKAKIQQLQQKLRKNQQYVNKLQIEVQKLSARERKIEEENIGKCKICWVKNATFINKICGHLNLCEDHVKEEKYHKNCCTCRAQGNYMRVFGSLIYQ